MVEVSCKLECVKSTVMLKAECSYLGVEQGKMMKKPKKSCSEQENWTYSRERW